MAVAKFKTKIFDTIRDLEIFVTGNATVASVQSVITDNSGKYILIYTTT